MRIKTLAKLIAAAVLFVVWLATSPIGYLISGAVIGQSIHPSHHEPNYYSCACDETPSLASGEAILLGIADAIVCFVAIYALMRMMRKPPKRSAAIAGALSAVAIPLYLLFYFWLTATVTG